ncbi:hypothetical protein MBLNU230_g0456t1 [Neophaeotheca triangularis]
MDAPSPQSPPSMDEPKLHNAFFYGTLMAPKVLHRVCFGHNPTLNPRYNTDSITPKPAILHDFRRHRVKFADYPAIVPARGSTVRGLYVTGLTDRDMYRLDAFEGPEYGRYAVKARVLEEVGEGGGEGNVEGDEVEADTYVWEAGEARLEAREWDFAEFQREKMRFWTGEAGQREFAVAEVDEAVAELEAKTYDGTGGRGVNGHIGKQLEEVQQKDGVKEAV